MKVFISWSGERSRAVGVALRDWLPLVLHFVKPWLSAADIDAGQRWATEVGQQLNDSSFGILCLTRDNLQAPWILFEAGAISKSVASGAVVPYLLDIDFSDVTGPLSQFQGKKADESSTLELVKGINNRAQEPVPNERLDSLFELTWPRLQEMLASAPLAATTTAQPPRPQREVLEELVQVVRAVEQRTRVLDSLMITAASDFASAVPVPTPTEEWKTRAVLELYGGNKIGAIKAVREGMGLGLKEGKDVVESWKLPLEEVRSQLQNKNRTNALKALRGISQLAFSLKEAQALVDAWEREY
jgi:ribosomal protein L7/L12